MEQNEGENSLNEGENSLFDLTRTLWNHKYGMTAVFLVVLTIVYIITITQKPVYEIFTSIMVKYGREHIYRAVDEAEEGDVRPMVQFNTDQVINNLLQVFTSTEVLENVIKKLDIEELFPGIVKRNPEDKRIPASINRFRQNLAVAHIKGSDIIGVKFHHQSPEVAVKAVEFLNEAFKERHLQIYKNPRTAFLEKQVVESRQKLRKYENDLRIYKEKNKIYSLKEQRYYLIEQRVRLESSLIENKSEYEEMQNKVVSIKEQLKDTTENTVLWDSMATEKNRNLARERLLMLKLKERELSEQYPDNNRLLVAARKDVKLVQAFIDAEIYTPNKLGIVRTGKSFLYERLQRDLNEALAAVAGMQAKVEKISAEHDRLLKRLIKIPEQEMIIRNLALLVDTTETSYTEYVIKLEENRVLDAMDSQKMVSIVIIEKPTLPMNPIKPRKRINFLIGIILGVACAVSYAVFFDYFTKQSKVTG